MTLVGWLKNKTHLLTAAVGASSNYEMIVKTYFGAGTDGTETINGEVIGKVYLNSLCNSDFSDVRFGSSDGVSLYSQKRVSYVASSYAIFIFKVAESLSANESIIVYYGNPAAFDVSSDFAAEVVLSGLVGAWNFDVSDIEVSPIVICDDNQAAFWTSTHGSLVLSNDTANKNTGTDCLKIVMTSTPQIAGFYHVFAANQDYSAKDHITLRMYGANSGNIWLFGVTNDTGANVSYGGVGLLYTLITDNWIGWRTFAVQIKNMLSFNSPDLTTMRKFIWYVNSASPVNCTWYLDRVVVDVDNFCADSSGSGNHGTLYGANNGAITGATRVAGGLSFDGTDDYVAIPDNIRPDTLVISCHITPSDITLETQTIFGWGNSGPTAFAFLDEYAATLRFVWQFGGTTGLYQSGNVLANNVACHIVLVQAGANAVPTLYINGSQVSFTGSVTDSVTLSSLPCSIGRVGAANRYYYKGVVNTLRVYNNVADIISIINNVRVDSGLVGEWLFEEISGATAYDTHLKTSSGKYGDAFNAEMGYVAIPYSATYKFGTGDFSVAIWLKPTLQAAGDHIILRCDTEGQAGTRKLWGLNSSVPNHILFEFYAADVTPATQSITSTMNHMSDGYYHHIVAGRSGTKLFLYIDGVLDQWVDETVSRNFDSVLQSITVGRSVSSNTFFYSGGADEIKLFNVALSQAQITALYYTSPKAYAASPLTYEDLGLLPGSIFMRKWVVAAQPAHSTWGTETSSWGLSRLSSMVVLPIVNNIMPRGGCNVDIFTQDGAMPILNITSQTEDMLSLQGSICIPNQNDDLYLITNYLLPLIAMKGKAVTLYSPNALFDGEWLLRDYSFPKVAEGAFARYRFTLNLSKGYSINEL